MSKLFQKIYSAVLAATMVVGAFSILPRAIEVRADETEITVHVSGTIGHDSDPKNDINITESGVTKTTWILDDDVTFVKGQRAKVQNGEFILDLNGHTWTAVTGYSAIAMAPNTKMTIIDSSEEKTGKMVGSSQYIIDVSTYPNSQTVILDGICIEGGTAGIAKLSAGMSLTMNNTIVRNVSGNKALIDSLEAEVTINNCTFENCSSSGSGGVLFADNNTLTITNSTFTNCSARNGGALFIQGSNVNLYHCTVSNCTFTGNSADIGGAIYLNKSDVNNGCILENLTITGNTASKGAGMFCSSFINKVILRGTINIHDNNNDNLYLTTNLDAPKVFIVDGPLSGRIGISTSVAPTSSSPVVITSGLTTSGSDNIFVCDNTTHLSVVSNGEVMLKDLAVSTEAAIECSTRVSLIYYVNIPAEDQTSGTTFTYKVAGVTNTLDWADHVEIDGKTGFRVPLKPTEMNCPITATLHLGANDADVSVDTLTLKAVAESYIDDASLDQKYKTLAEAILIYGGCAQRQFGSDYSDADTGVTNNDSKAAEISAMFEAESARMAKVESEDSDIRYYGSTLFFLSQNTLRHYFYVSGDIADYTFTVDGSTKTPVQVTGTNFYYIQTAGLTSADFDTVFSIAVTEGGSQVVSFEYSAMTYLAKIYANPTSSTMQDLAYATAYYVVSCDDIY